MHKFFLVLICGFKGHNVRIIIENIIFQFPQLFVILKFPLVRGLRHVKLIKLLVCSFN
jgi:hypothetical protein